MTSEYESICHQEVLECNGIYAIIWYKGEYFIGRLIDKEYIRHKHYLTLMEAESAYNQLLKE